MDWDALLSRLAAAPRENGSAALQDTARFLSATVTQMGLPVEPFVFTAYPYRHRLSGLVALGGALLYFHCLRRRRFGWGLTLALLLPVLLLSELDRGIALYSRLGALHEEHVIARVGVAQPRQRVLLMAHYDSKTDLLDHVERAPIDLLSLPVTILMITGALVGWWSARRRSTSDAHWLVRVAGPVTALYGVGVALVLSAGALVPQRSPGALDDGAACAVLVRVAQSLAASPLTRTDVEIAWLAGEEIGVQGSWEYARARFATPPAVATFVINMEFIGAAADLAVYSRELFQLRSYPADPQLVAILDAVHSRLRGKPLHVTWYGAATDARSFLAHGIPAATLSSDLPGHALPRHLHSARDDRSRIDRAALEATVTYLVATLREIDADG